MRRGPKTKPALSPKAAVLILIVCAAVAAKSLFGDSSAEGVTANVPTMPTELVVDDDAQQATDATVWRDLLAAHGSMAKGTPVTLAFRLPADAVAAAPTGEIQLFASESDWDGGDPPNLKLGVVMISEATRRAVLGGQVVGVGDEVGGVRVTSIARGLVTTQWLGRRLSYDLEQPAPREFRAELARRAERQTGNDTRQAPTAKPVSTNKDEGR